MTHYSLFDSQLQFLRSFMVILQPFSKEIENNEYNTGWIQTRISFPYKAYFQVAAVLSTMLRDFLSTIIQI